MRGNSKIDTTLLNGAAGKIEIMLSLADIRSVYDHCSPTSAIILDMVRRAKGLAGQEGAKESASRWVQPPEIGGGVQSAHLWGRLHYRELCEVPEITACRRMYKLKKQSHFGENSETHKNDI